LLVRQSVFALSELKAGPTAAVRLYRVCNKQPKSGFKKSEPFFFNETARHPRPSPKSVLRNCGHIREQAFARLLSFCRAAHPNSLPQLRKATALGRKAAKGAIISEPERCKKSSFKHTETRKKQAKVRRADKQVKVKPCGFSQKNLHPSYLRVVFFCEKP
jgi:hypothetical protein